MARPKLIVIAGPTASGKSRLAVRIAQKFSGEIVSADSRQVYKGLDVGTGKITPEETEGIPHYCIDIANPKKTFTVDEYRHFAESALEKIYSRGHIPVIAGGTGFYINAILYGASYPVVPPNWKLRNELEKKQTPVLMKTLTRLAPERAAAIDPHNRRRIIRAIEIVRSAGWIPPEFKKPQFDALIIGIKTEPPTLRKKISKRLLGWLAAGFIDEVRALHTKQKIPWQRFEELGLDYKYAAHYLQGDLSYDEMVSKTDTEIWHYAKRQITYFKKMPGIIWIRTQREAEKLVRDFL